MCLNENLNKELLNHNLNAINELRENAHLCTAFYQHKVAQHYQKNIRVRKLKVGDWLLL